MKVFLKLMLLIIGIILYQLFRPMILVLKQTESVKSKSAKIISIII